MKWFELVKDLEKLKDREAVNCFDGVNVAVGDWVGVMVGGGGKSET